MLLLKIKVLLTVTFAISAFKRSLETEETMTQRYVRVLSFSMTSLGWLSSSNGSSPVEIFKPGLVRLTLNILAVNCSKQSWTGQHSLSRF